MITRIYSKLLLVTLLFLPLISTAATPAWEIVPDKSSLTFIATQNNAPVNGKFKVFSGDINFDPNQLNTSNATVYVDMNSVESTYEQMVQYLKTSEWFDVKDFPEATFKTTSFTKTGNDTYQVNGIMTIRGKSKPVTFSVKLGKYSATTAEATGVATIKRSDFDIGQGEWASTDQIKDEVTVNFALSAAKK